MHRVFISYRRNDAESEAQRLAEALRRRDDVQVFLDTSEIRPGSKWRSDIADALAAAELVFVVIGPTWLTVGMDEFGRRRIEDPDDWVRREVQTALNAKKQVVPVLVRNGKMPPSAALPKALADLPGHQAFMIGSGGSWDRDVDHLLRATLGEADDTARGDSKGEPERPEILLIYGPRDQIHVRDLLLVVRRERFRYRWRGFRLRENTRAGETEILSALKSCSASVLLVTPGLMATFKSSELTLRRLHQQAVDIGKSVFILLWSELEKGHLDELKAVSRGESSHGLRAPHWGLDKPLAGMEAAHRAALLHEGVGMLDRSLRERTNSPAVHDRGMPHELIGTTVGDRYRLIEYVGRGGFGEVFRGEPTDGFGEDVAVKILLREWAHDETTKRRFFDAPAMMRSLASEHIVQIVSGCELDAQLGRPYFVMEYIHGSDLDVFASEAAPPWDEVVRLIQQIAEALHVAHQHGIIHRDVKPQNILVSRAGVAKLTDFDLVLVSKRSRLTRTGPLGTFMFAAPEVLVDATRATTSSDVYSLAMTMVSALMRGDLPPSIISHAGEVLREVACPESVKRVLRGVLLPPAEARAYQTAKSFAAALADATARARIAVEVPEVGRSNLPKTISLSPSLPLTMVQLPPGNLRMGSPSDEPGRGDDEEQRTLEVQPFWMATKPVTAGLWLQIVSWDPGFVAWDTSTDLSELPAHFVSWDDAVRFCNALSESLGLECCYERAESKWLWHRRANGFRLPTEAEWEWAARAGDNHAYGFGDSPANLPDHAWYLANSGRRPHAVGTRRPSVWDLYDMHGNVWEWVWDEYRTNPCVVGCSPETLESHDDSVRVLRGGGFRSADLELRCAHRDRMLGKVRDADFGFRVARG